MGLDDQNPIFLSQEEEEFHMLQQIQTQSGESFDYKQGYDSTIFEVHKQYNLRRRRNAGPPDQTKKAMANQPKITNKVPISEVLKILPKPNQNPPSPIIEEITAYQPSVEQPPTSVPLKEPEKNTYNARSEIPHKEIPNKQKEHNSTQNLVSKVCNPSSSFNLGAGISKLKILVPLTELVKNKTYKSQVNQTLNITKNEDLVNLMINWN